MISFFRTPSQSVIAVETEHELQTKDIDLYGFLIMPKLKMRKICMVVSWDHDVK